jgi:tRNA threonylcarbamoyladenosine biosynthesis protein TsaB
MCLELGARYSERILPEIIHVLSQLDLKAEDLDYVVVNEGPGAFTGLRLAYVTAKALTLSAGVPVYAVPTLRAFAYPFRDWGAAVIPCLDAKQGRFFTALYRRGAECAPALARAPTELAALADVEERVFVVGSPDAATLAEDLKALRPTQEVYALDSATPASLFTLAEEQIRARTPPLPPWAGPEYIVGI